VGALFAARYICGAMFMWERYKIFIITLTALLGAMAVFAFGPRRGKCRESA
jgi:hypothetical protein